MKHEISKFRVDVIRTDRVPDIPGSWTKEEYQQVLDACEFDWLIEMADEELPDYAIISLLDYSPEEAAEIVLKVKLGDRLNRTQIKNLAHQMQEEKMWEEYADLSLHEKLFYCHVLLAQAFPKFFPDAEAMRCILEVSPQTGFSKELLSYGTESLIVRMLADGMNSRGILKRLFEDQLVKGPFPEAEHIIWQYEMIPSADGGTRVQIYSSAYWLNPLPEVSHYESSAFSDLKMALRVE